MSSDGKYDLDFKSASLINVLNVLSGLSGINFVAGREVADRPVNMTLSNAGLEDVLQSLVYGCNVTYDFIPGKNIYVFRGASDAAGDPGLLTRVFKLYYARVTKMQGSDFSSGDQGAAEASSGKSFASAGNPEEGQETSLAKAIAKILSPRGTVSVDDRSNSLIVTDFEDRLKRVESTIAQLDRPLDQVLIEMLLIETAEDLDRDLGLEWSDPSAAWGTVGPGKSASQLQKTLKDLEKASKLKVLARPRIMVLDNHPALVKIATDAAIGEVVTLSGGQGREAGFPERAEVGTVLRVTPLINASDRITLNVEPRFTTVAPSTFQTGGGPTADPTVRMAHTTMMVQNGQTVALGGMLWEASAERSDRELILFVMPRIVTGNQMSAVPDPAGT